MNKIQQLELGMLKVAQDRRGEANRDVRMYIRIIVEAVENRDEYFIVSDNCKAYCRAINFNYDVLYMIVTKLWS